MTESGSGVTKRLSAGGRGLRVLVVDDSAVVRQVMARVLAEDPRLSVVVAADPFIAMDKMKRDRPDVILLDLQMPRMDGLTFLQKLMAEDPIPVVVCSGAAGQGSDAALRALDEGAVEIVAKPTLGVAAFLESSAHRLIETLYTAAAVRVRPRGLAKPAPGKRLGPAAPSNEVRSAATSDHRIIAVGASTGGPQALGLLLTALPRETPGFVIVQHMPQGFTAALAARLDAECVIAVKEAENGDRVVCGRALIAPGDHHMVLLRNGPRFSVGVRSGPPVSGHCPSVDILFRSVARAAGPVAVGVLLTGMGSDGADGLCEIKKAGGHTIAQDEETCAVFGMPKQAIVRGGVDEVVPVGNIAATVLKRRVT